LQFLAANHFDFNQLFLKGMYSIAILHIPSIFFSSGIPFICKTIYLDKLKQLPSSHQTDADLAIKKMIGFSEVIWYLIQSILIGHPFGFLSRKVQESGKPIIGHNLYTDIIHLINQFFTPIPAVSYEVFV
jgi:hypothetical protein